MRGSAYTIRMAEPDDVPALCDLKWMFAVHEGSTDVVRASVADWRRDMFGPQPHFFALVAEIGSGVVGMATVAEKYCPGWVGPLCTVDDLFVMPEHRRHGLGKALLAHASAEAIRRGSPFIELTVRESNPALQLYSRVGFKRVPGAVTLVLAGDELSALAGPSVAKSA
jgi:ribosomal protein S18 acetylase RimI-like enzyme